MTNEELVICIQNEGDPEGELMLQLWNQNQRFVSMMANRYRGMAEVDDLEMEGYISLCTAVDKWKPGKPFLNYAAYWIRQGMVRYIEKNQQISISMQGKIRKMRQVIADYQQATGEGPSEAVICDLMDISEDELASIKQAEIAQNNASLDAPYSEDEELSLADVVSGVDDPEAGAVDAYQQEELASVIWDEVDRLPEDQADTLHKRYEDQLTAKQIGAETGKSGQQVADIERRALTKMRTTKRTRDALLPFWNDSEIRSAALQGNGVGVFNRTWSSSTEKTAIRMIEKSTDSSE